MAMNIQQSPFMCDEDENAFVDLSNNAESGTLLDSDDALHGSDAPLLSSKVAERQSGNGNFQYGSGDGNASRSQSIVLSEPNRFLQLVVSTLCCLAVSASYTFNLYNGQIQSKYDFTQSQMTTITTISDLVGGFVLPFGALYDYFGASSTFFCTLLTYPLGPFLYGLAFLDVTKGSIPVFAVYSSLQSIGNSLLDMSAVMTMLANFPADRGAVVGVMKTFSGMGSAILGAIHLAFFSSDTNSDASHYFFFLTALTATAAFLGLIFVHLPPYIVTGYEMKTFSAEQIKARQSTKEVYLRQRAPMSRFAVGFVIVLFLLIFLPVQGALSAYLHLGSTYHIVFASIAIGAFACFPIMALPIKFFEPTADDEALSDSNSEDDASESRERMSRLSRISRKLAGTSRGLSEIRAARASRSAALEQSGRSSSRDSVSTARLEELEYTAPQYQTTLLQNLATVRLWAIVWTLFSIFGSNIVILGNSRFVLSALSGKLLDDSFMAMIVVLLGVGSGLGRIALCVIETVTQGKPAEKRIPITCALLLPVILSFTAILLLLSLPPKAIPLPVFLLALGNGSTAAGIVIVLRTIFAKDIGKTFNVATLSVPIASLLLNRVMYAEWYTREAAKQGGTICLGKHCVIMPLLVCLGMVFTSFFSAFYVHWDYSRFCKKMLELKRNRLGRKVSDRTSSSSVLDKINVSNTKTLSKEDAPDL